MNDNKNGKDEWLFLACFIGIIICTAIFGPFGFLVPVGLLIMAQ